MLYLSGWIGFLIVLRQSGHYPYPLWNPPAGLIGMFWPVLYTYVYHPRTLEIRREELRISFLFGTVRWGRQDELHITEWHGLGASDYIVASGSMLVRISAGCTWLRRADGQELYDVSVREFIDAIPRAGRMGAQPARLGG